jgi:hypothetical protein
MEKKLPITDKIHNPFILGIKYVIIACSPKNPYSLTNNIPSLIFAMPNDVITFINAIIINDGKNRERSCNKLKNKTYNPTIINEIPLSVENASTKAFIIDSIVIITLYFLM